MNTYQPFNTFFGIRGKNGPHKGVVSPLIWPILRRPKPSNGRWGGGVQGVTIKLKGKGFLLLYRRLCSPRPRRP